MCGIFGFSGFEEDGLLERMDRILVHRGPDDSGRYCNSDRVSLGMRRLSIIDLESGNQPLFNEDHSVVAFNNGEIYNYVELADELTRKGHRFDTRSDTEVLAHGYEEWGVDFVDRLNGMFAAIIYDVHRKELVLTRDRAGQKPLYYYHKDGRFIFASEIKAILESRHVERVPNEAAIDSYLGLRYTPQPHTFFRDIFVLPAAHRLVLKDGQVRIERYWDVELGTASYSSDREAIDAMEELFFDSIRLTMRSDVPVGAYLSGGVDSSLIVAAMCRLSDKVKTYSLGFDSPIDETEQARDLASRLGTDHHEITCLPEDLELLPKVVWHMDRPVGESLIVAYYKLAEETAKDLKVVLAGEGADELFAGYSFHKVIQWTERYASTVPDVVNSGFAVPALKATPVGLLNKLFVYPAFLGEKGKKRTVSYLSEYRRRTLAENYVALRTLWDEGDRFALYADDKKHLVSQDWIHQSHDNGGPFLDRLLKLQFDDWLQDFALMRQDKNSMAHSLELRLPFLDHRLIEFAFRLPGNMKVRGLKDKYIERMAAKDYLPPENTRRSKNPFYLPIEYFYGHKGLDELMNFTLDDERIRKRGYFDPERVRFLRDRVGSGEFLYVKQIMSMVILELWHTIFIDRQQLW